MDDICEPLARDPPAILTRESEYFGYWYSFLKGSFGYKKTSLTDLVKDESIPLRDTTLLHPSLAGAGLTGYRHTLAL